MTLDSQWHWVGAYSSWYPSHDDYSEDADADSVAFDGWAGTIPENDEWVRFESQPPGTADEG